MEKWNKHEALMKAVSLGGTNANPSSAAPGPAEMFFK